MNIDVKGPIVSDSDAWAYDWLNILHCAPGQVIQALQNADGKDIDVYINSGGGSIFAGSEIYSALRGYPGNVRIHVVGLAASAASVIACAGPSDISPTGMVMVHNVSSPGSDGDYHVKDQESEILRKANSAIAAAYVAKTGMSESEALDMMEKETWLTAGEAVRIGLIDAISGPAESSLVASVSGSILPESAINKIMKAFKYPAAKKAQLELDILKLKGEQQ